MEAVVELPGAEAEELQKRVSALTQELAAERERSAARIASLEAEVVGLRSRVEKADLARAGQAAAVEGRKAGAEEHASGPGDAPAAATEPLAAAVEGRKAGAEEHASGPGDAPAAATEPLVGQCRPTLSAAQIAAQLGYAGMALLADLKRLDLQPGGPAASPPAMVPPQGVAAAAATARSLMHPMMMPWGAPHGAWARGAMPGCEAFRGLHLHPGTGGTGATSCLEATTPTSSCEEAAEPSGGGLAAARDKLMSILKVGEAPAEAQPQRGEPEPLSLDEYALWEMQAREDLESGADMRNKETFGTDGRCGWSFEENVLANERIARMARQPGACQQSDDTLGDAVASSGASAVSLGDSAVSTAVSSAAQKSNGQMQTPRDGDKAKAGRARTGARRRR